MLIDEKSEPANYKPQNENIKYFAVLHYCVPILLELISDPSQKSVPHSGADNRIDGKFNQIHLAHSGRNRNQMSYNRYKPADENRFLPMTFEEILSRNKTLIVKQKIFAIPVDKPPATIQPDVIRGNRTCNTSKCAYCDYTKKSKPTLRDNKSGKRHDSFARDREDHAFHNHKNVNACVAGNFYELSDVSCEELAYTHNINL